MIDRRAFLADTQKLVAKLEKDLRARCDEMPDVGQAVSAEYKLARDAGRTAQALEEWRADAITQQAVAWVLSCVFVRFLEDNRLIDPPKLAGPGDRLPRARDEHEQFFRSRPHDTDREYLLAVFDDLAKRAGTRDLFGAHNPIRQLPGWLSPDAAKDLLLPFFQRIDAGSGRLIHDFTDPALDTRFLGDLYQDLSEAARKKYALLQTPVFVEEFILDRTLDPAIETFGLDKVRLIDPACGSGHFMLGAFARLLDRWMRREPATPRRELVQRALDAVHGVDLNPYAVAIARFRLLLAAWQACGITSLANAPEFRLNLACGDSLLHGSTTATQGSLGFDGLHHHYQPEDPAELERLLRPGGYHAVVANPPYITPKDRGLNDKYRERYSACHMKYSLAVPFMQRIFDLAYEGGFTGQITANSFMKREFGRKMIQEFFPTIDLTHVVDTSLAHIPDYGTPTVILFGRNTRPVAGTVRAVTAIKREDEEPADPAKGKVWSAIIDQIDRPGSPSAFISVADWAREKFHKHPWSIGGGGAAELKQRLDAEATVVLKEVAQTIGYAANVGDDDAFLLEAGRCWRLKGIDSGLRSFAVGACFRDWGHSELPTALYPHGSNGDYAHIANADLHYWALRSCLRDSKVYGETREQRGRDWREFAIIVKDKLFRPESLIFSFVSTHNNFSFDKEGVITNKSAPSVKLPLVAGEIEHLGLLGLLNSSTACFWMKQTFYSRGGGGVGGGIAAEAWEQFYEHDGTKLKQFPVSAERPPELAKRLDSLARKLADEEPSRALGRSTGIPDLSPCKSEKPALRGTMIRLQEDLDWQCYLLYGLMSDDLVDPHWQARKLPIKLGERAFEIFLARKIHDEGLHTTWFERHSSTPISDLPAHWPGDYRDLVERRIAAIESSPQMSADCPY